MHYEKTEGGSKGSIDGDLCGWSIACLAFPWIIAFAVFAFGHPDGEQECWVIPNDLRVSQVQTEPHAVNIAAKWRMFYIIGFVAQVLHVVMHALMGCFIFGAKRAGAQSLI